LLTHFGNVLNYIIIYNKETFFYLLNILNISLNMFKQFKHKLFLILNWKKR